MTAPLVSVVMAVRNAARYLRESLDSVTAQTVGDVEIVLVDGRSTDDTAAIAASYPRVRFLQETGTGFASAWNDGIAAARGELIALLDSDDRWPPDKLAWQIEALRAAPDAMGAVGRVKYFLEPGEGMPFGFRPELLEGDHVAYMPGALLGRRRLFDAVGPFGTEWTIASDIDWFARLKDLGCPLVVLPRVVIHKRVHASNLSYTTARGRAVRDEVMRLLRDSIRRQRAGERSAIDREGPEGGR